MIVAKTFYTLICDSCGEDLNEGQEVTAWSSIEANYEVASASTWHVGVLVETDAVTGKAVIAEKHFCPNCYTVNDSGKTETK